MVIIWKVENQLLKQKITKKFHRFCRLIFVYWFWNLLFVRDTTVVFQKPIDWIACWSNYQTSYPMAHFKQNNKNSPQILFKQNKIYSKYFSIFISCNKSQNAALGIFFFLVPFWVEFQCYHFGTKIGSFGQNLTI
jgi:hypothetical protein